MIQIIKSETINEFTVEAVTDDRRSGNKNVSVNLHKHGASEEDIWTLQVSDWTDADSAATVFAFVVSSAKAKMM